MKKNSRRPKKNIYHIILTSNGKRIKTLYNCASEKLVNSKFNKLIEENKNVKFPVRYINVGKLVKAHYELFIIKRNDDDKEVIKLKDNDGKIKGFKTDDEDWVIYDRSDYEKEETFWVYGFHPIFQRKDFSWIYDNLISKNVSKESAKQVLVYQNKLLISTAYDLQIVFCKNISDCVRLYNELERERDNNKLKYVFFNGDVYNSYVKGNWLKKMKELTGWDSHKLARKSLRP